MNDAARIMYDRAERLWQMAEDAERQNRTRDVVDNLRRDAAWCRIVADLRRQEGE